MEKLLDSYIRDNYLLMNPIHRFQFAYQPGKSTVTAIHQLTTQIEKAIGANNIALCAFIDIQGAFDNTSYSAIDLSLYRKGVPHIIRNWILEMLSSRVIKLDLGGSSKTIRATRGCPQGGVLSPLLWTLVIDELLEELNNLGFRTYGYADDLVISVTGWDDVTISERMQTALNITNKWCLDKGLTINPAKTIIVPFTKRRGIRLIEPTLNGSSIGFSKEVKYLGVTLDSSLTWNSHLSNTIKRATRALYACQRLFGKTWGLRPKMIYWSFITIIRPIITYAALAWWKKVEQMTARSQLDKVYRLICISITGSMKTCPTHAMGAILHIPPLHLLIMEEAYRSASRLPEISRLLPGDLVGHISILGIFANDPSIAVSDYMSKTLVLNRRFNVLIPKRDEWLNQTWWQTNADQVWFTDGSKQANGDTGAGIYGPNFQRGIPMGTFPSIFQAEIYAILICSNECLRRRVRHNRIFIMSDSQAALRALSSYEIRSRVVMDCWTSLNELGTHNELTLCWVPGHEGHAGNERADCLANRGARRPFIGPEPFFGIPRGYTMERISSWVESEFSRFWNNLPGLRQSKRFITLSKRRSQLLLSLGKGELRLLTGLFTGHCGFRYHQFTLGNVANEQCRFCELEAETSEHILCNCPMLAIRRTRWLGRAFMAPGDVFDLSSNRIIGFIHSLNLT